MRAHSGISGTGPDLTSSFLSARAEVESTLNKRLTMNSPDGRKSQVRFPFMQVGVPGIYNVTADLGLFGVEVRPIPQDDISSLLEGLGEYCVKLELVLNIPVKENGFACDPANPYVKALLKSVEQLSGQDPAWGADSRRRAPALPRVDRALSGGRPVSVQTHAMNGISFPVFFRSTRCSRPGGKGCWSSKRTNPLGKTKSI